MNYHLPKTYIPRNKTITIENSDKKASAMPDGPIWKITKSKRGHFLKFVSYGKDGNKPPLCYLGLKDWASKPDPRINEDKKRKRKTFIDSIIEYNKKYNCPGPEKYCPEVIKEVKKSEFNNQRSKSLMKPSYLDDIIYKGKNNPAPGSYNPKVILY